MSILAFCQDTCSRHHHKQRFKAQHSSTTNLKRQKSEFRMVEVAGITGIIYQKGASYVEKKL